ncbi:MAG TPA: hypothetical protein ENF75_06810 [Acidilobales archaeon]|nr:MAG: hypothetical protein B6U85_09930 [Desulfurococcales archaeon ex4484_42]HDD26774.1 hypothetical protein [Acidilobales archaeon]
MTASEAIFKAKLLQKKFGIIGKVAGNYLLAGFNVKVIGRDYLSFIAIRGGERYGVLVVENIKDVVAKAEKLVNVAKKLNLIPVLVIYGRQGLLPPDVYEKIRELGVKVKYFRP